MASPKQQLFFFFSLFHLLHLSQQHHHDCPSSSCGPHEFHVRFPFRLPHQSHACGYPGFNLFCDVDHQKTAIELPKSGKFIVREIDYLTQQMYLSDPDRCLAGRLLRGFDTSDSPLSPPLLLNYTFLRCPREAIVNLNYTTIECLGNRSSSVLATSDADLVKSMPSACETIKTLPVPVSWPAAAAGFNAEFSDELNDHDIMVTWDSPDCRDCERSQKRCGFLDNGLQVKCYHSHPGDFHTAFQILKVVALAVAGPTAVVATCVAIYVCTSSGRFNSRGEQPNSTATATATAQTNMISRTGLDETTIKSYKNVEVGESRRVPGPNGIVCPICLSEYATKETVRCMPECEHCFHTECIDEWLKLHGSCPLCRYSPYPLPPPPPPPQPPAAAV